MPDTPQADVTEGLKSLRIQRDAPRAGLPGWLRWLLVLAAVALALFLGWSALAERLFLATVETTTVSLVSPVQAQQLLVATGYVVPQRKANVAPRIGGRVLRIYVEDGTEVKAGQLLAELESADYRAQLLQAQANLRQAEARRVRAQVDEKDAQRAFEREQAVQAKGVSTAQALDLAVARIDGARAQSGAAEAEVAAARALVEVARVSLDNCFVRAPFAGRITQKLADVGEIVFGAVGAGAGGNGGIASLADFDSLMVEADVSESQVARLQPGTPAEIALDAYPGRSFRARVHEVRPRVDRAKATVTVKVAFADSTEGVLPDMGAKVTFLARELAASEARAPPTPAVQPEAVQSRGERKVVWVVTAEGSLQEAPVVLGPAIGNLVSLKSGPPAGTKIVQRPSPELKGGLRVKEKQP